MASKKGTKATTANSPPALKIGSRVRCTEDGIAGRIVWANGVSLKIQWDDGEQVTWRRDSLAERPIEIHEGGEEGQSGPLTPEAEAGSVQAAVETPPWAVVVEGLGVFVHEDVEITDELVERISPSGVEQDAQPARMAGASCAAEPATEPMDEPVASGATNRSAPSKRRREEAPSAKEKKVSALDAAVQVLAEARQALNCQDMIAAMAAKGYWTSPSGKTPAATLYSAIAREIAVKGSVSRFVKAQRGKFALASAV